MRSRREQKEIEAKRDYLVVKHNNLIQRSRFELSVAEQKTVAYICSKIKPRDGGAVDEPLQLEYDFNIRDYAEVCGFSTGGKFYNETKELFRKLMQRIINVELDEDDLLIAWLDFVRMSKRNGTVKIRLNPEIAMFLFDLQNDFTQYGLLNILAMKSQYSIRIYELMRSMAYKHMPVTISMDEIRQLLMIEDKATYKTYSDFRRKLLESSIEEINKYTDISVNYEPVTKGERKVIKIDFYISHKAPTERHISWTKVYKDIDNK